MAPSVIRFQNTSADGVLGEILELDYNFAAGLFLDLLERCGNAVESVIFPLKVNVSDASLRRVVDWLRDRGSREDTSTMPAAWDGLRSLEPPELFSMSVAASYLDLPELFRECSETLVSVVPGLGEDELRRVFGLDDNFAVRDGLVEVYEEVVQTGEMWGYLRSRVVGGRTPRAP
ncbi:hypothetical protein B0T22DRAFT_440474 [Podospora appendiculata]|uniref:Uncharacterized protein n=1 Tax=Podospora appendiculata TaxID=314037 RepID=A0AAE0XB35_9PEZI|nr:hypothetical protein B0T22DRAFT_440474 [Podospora appendiculata]